MTNRSKKVNFRSFTAVESFVCHRLKAKPHGWLVSLEQLRQCYFPTAVSEDPANCSKYHLRNTYKHCQAFSNVAWIIEWFWDSEIISMILHSLPRKCAYLPSGLWTGWHQLQSQSLAELGRRRLTINLCSCDRNSVQRWSIMSSQQDIHFCKELSSSNVMMHTPSFRWWYIIPYISKAKFQAKACQCHYGKSKSKTDVGVLVRFPSSTVLRQVDTGQNLKHQQLLSHASLVAKMCEGK